jgi:hypothetical protein
MNGFQKTVFMLYGVICLLAGTPLLIAPGSFLGIFQWAPIDPLISRLLGAAMLGMAWGAWQTFHQDDLHLASLMVEIYFIFTIAGAIGWLRHLVVAHWWPGIWAVCIVMLVFSLAWAYVWYQLKKVPEHRRRVKKVVRKTKPAH